MECNSSSAVRGHGKPKLANAQWRKRKEICIVSQELHLFAPHSKYLQGRIFTRSVYIVDFTEKKVMFAVGYPRMYRVFKKQVYCHPLM